MSDPVKAFQRALLASRVAENSEMGRTAQVSVSDTLRHLKQDWGEALGKHLVERLEQSLQQQVRIKSYPDHIGLGWTLELVGAVWHGKIHIDMKDLEIPMELEINGKTERSLRRIDDNTPIKLLGRFILGWVLMTLGDGGVL